MTGNFNSVYNAGNYAKWFHFFMNPFIYVDNQLLNVNNDTLSVPYNTEAWRNGLKYIRSLFAEGLLPLENLTQDESQVRTLLNSDPVRVGSFFMTSSSNINSEEIAQQYIGGPPLKGLDGSQYSTMVPSVANIRFMISANCKNPEAAFKVGDVMMKEDLSISNRFGEQGVNWDYPDAVPNAASKFALYMEGWPGKAIIYDDSVFWGGSAVANASWRQNGPLLLTYSILQGRLIPQETAVGRQANNSVAITMYNKDAFGPKEVVGKLIYTDDEMSFISETRTALNNYILEMTSNFLAGNRDIDTSWNAYLSELNSIGLARYISINQTVYNRMYK